ncbi:MAG: orotidine-5'-phosphate decarboxylase [Actinobacteria bacterium]|nr:orotidine-5'-phosphate decarboxylase [Actinomycetota bacterium]
MKRNRLKLEDRLVISMDVGKKSELISECHKIGGLVSTVKLGLEVLYNIGLEAVDVARSFGYRVMLDAKLMDIPNTVNGAARGIAALCPSIVTMHALGGENMLRQAKITLKEESQKRENRPPLLFAVTILTSLDDGDLGRMGFSAGHIDTVTLLAGIALKSGADGIICSPNEVKIIRDRLGTDFLVATPGIRLAGDDRGDQKRVNTPGEAVRAGSDILIVGRSVTQSGDLKGTVEIIKSEIKDALKQ